MKTRSLLPSCNCIMIVLIAEVEGLGDIRMWAYLLPRAERVPNTVTYLSLWQGK